MKIIGVDEEYIANVGSYFTVETHIRHLDEVLIGEKIYSKTQVIVGAAYSFVYGAVVSAVNTWLVLLLLLLNVRYGPSYVSRVTGDNNNSNINNDKSNGDNGNAGDARENNSSGSSSNDSSNSDKQQRQRQRQQQR